MRFIGSIFVLFFYFILFPVSCFGVGNYKPGTRGYDISFPQCGSAYPSKPYDFIIVGITGGKAFTKNPCLVDEFFWAKRTNATTSVYMNLNYPVESLEFDPYAYGYSAAEDAYQYASSQVIYSSVWWLDIELANSWSDNIYLNRKVVEGAIDYLSSVSVAVGVYSIPSDWKAIVGSNFIPTQELLFPVPNWVVGNGNPAVAAFYCLYPFTMHGIVQVVQNTQDTFDEDYICP